MTKKINEMLAGFIDLTKLAPQTRHMDIIELCEFADKYLFRGVCVPPYCVPSAASILRDSPVKVISVVNFPLGNLHPLSVTENARKLVEFGVHELDIVLNIGDMKSKRWCGLERTMEKWIEKIPVPIKFIIETGLLTKEEKIKIANIMRDNNVFAIKTSTGFVKGGATIEDVKLLKDIVGEVCQIKASGGIKTYEKAVELLEAGADILGTSSTTIIR
jgi:deoxyribose-phosphate aldolase